MTGKMRQPMNTVVVAAREYNLLLYQASKPGADSGEDFRSDLGFVEAGDENDAGTWPATKDSCVMDGPGLGWQQLS